MARLRCTSFAERALIPAFVFFFAMLYPFSRVNDPRSRVAAAAGGCILARIDALTKIGGIAAIKDALIDDCALAIKMKRHGPIRLDFGQHCRAGWCSNTPAEWTSFLSSWEKAALPSSSSWERARLTSALTICGLSLNWRENQPHQSTPDTSAGRNSLLDYSSVRVWFELLFGVESAGYKPGKVGQIRTSNGSSESMLY
jgi:hypothetical protein